MCVTWHAQSTQNKKLTLFAISPEKHGSEVDFLPADKHESFLQDNSISLGVHSLAYLKYQKQQVCNTLQYLKENVKDEVDFLPADKQQMFLQLVLSF